MRTTPINLLFVFACALACAGCGGRAEQNVDRLAPSMASSAPPVLGILPADSPRVAGHGVERIKIEPMPAGEAPRPGKPEPNPNRVPRGPLPVAGRAMRVRVKLGDSVAAGQPLPTLESPEANAATTACR